MRGIVNWDDPPFHSVRRRLAACCIRAFEIWDDGFLGYVSLSGFVHRKFRPYIGHLVQDYKHKLGWHMLLGGRSTSSSFSCCCWSTTKLSYGASYGWSPLRPPLEIHNTTGDWQALPTGSCLPQTGHLPTVFQTGGYISIKRLYFIS